MNNSLKIWTGKVDAVIISRHLQTTNVENLSPDLDEAIDEFSKLSSIWKSYKGSCSNLRCSVCKRDGDKLDEDGGKDDNDNGTGSDGQEKDQDQESKENEGDEGDESDESDKEEEKKDEGEDGRMGDEEYNDNEADEEKESQHKDDG